jgi:hypothetical protein
MSLVMKQTVLFITDSYPPSNFGGIGRYTSEFAIALSLEGYDVHVFKESFQGLFSRVDYHS